MQSKAIYNPTASNRRHFIQALGSAGLFFTQAGAFAQTLTLTPAVTEGPYYPNVLPLDQDNDLLVINNAITPSVGTVSWISGRVLSAAGLPVRNALVEIWQADNVGSYIHTNGALNGQRDGNFQGYGRFLTASDGAYLFRTVKPGLYPGRVRHVHAKVTFPGGQTLTTQLFISGEANNDNILNGISNAAQRASVVRPWEPILNSPVAALNVNWDIVANDTAPETPTATRPTLIAANGISHGATFRPGAAAGSWITLEGTALANTTRTWTGNDIVNGKLPETLDGVSVRINNQPASVYYVSPKQLNVLAPDAVADGNVSVSVTNGTATSDPVTVNLQRIQPGFFQFESENIAAVHANGAPINANSPAQPNESILLFGTGFGPTSPAATPGQAFTAALPTSNPVRIQIHTQAVAVAYAGLVSPGLYQFNITVPDLPNGDYPLTAEIAGVRTSKFVKLRIERPTNA